MLRCQQSGEHQGEVLEREVWGVSFGQAYLTHPTLCDKHYTAAKGWRSMGDLRLIEEAIAARKRAGAVSHTGDGGGGAENGVSNPE